LATQTTELIRIKDLASSWKCVPATVHRWIKKGVLVDGQVKKLEGVRIGARWYVTRQAAQTWWNRLNGHIEVVEPGREMRAQSHARALAELREKWGLGREAREQATDGQTERRKRPAPA